MEREKAGAVIYSRLAQCISTFTQLKSLLEITQQIMIH